MKHSVKTKLFEMVCLTGFPSPPSTTCSRVLNGKNFTKKALAGAMV